MCGQDSMAAAQEDLAHRAKIDDKLPTPLYHQIYLILRDRILNGEYAYNDVLPSEQDLARKFGVSRITIKRALSELANEGFVSRRRGRGTVVRFRVPSPIVRANLDGLLENLLMMGLKTEVTLLDFGHRPVTGPLAKALELEEGAPVQYAVRSRTLGDEPFSYLVTHVPAAFAKNIRPEDITSTPLLALLEHVGVKIKTARQTITATAAEPEVAAALQVPGGSPVLKITRIARDENFVPVQHIVAYYRPDRYQYDMKLTRVAGEDGNIWDGEHQ